MAFSGLVGGWLADKFAEMALQAGKDGLVGLLKQRASRNELAEIGAASIEAACSAAPSLADDLRSPPFLGDVAIPMITALVEEPERVANAKDMASRYIDMFVARFAGDTGDDAALARIFQSDRDTVVGAFERFFDHFKSALYRSKHWGEAQHYRTAEQSFQSLVRIERKLDDLAAGRRLAAVDKGRAAQDAASASAELKAWPTEINGVRLEPPLLDTLLTHIAENPAGTSLLVGEAGTGKSALFARLAAELGKREITTYAIKADLLPEDITTLDDLAAALGVPDGLEDRIAALADEHPVALLIDQLDAVSDVMDRKSARMPLLLRLVHEIGERARTPEKPLAIHVMVSSRPFEAEHDARFQRLGAEKFQLGLLSDEQVETLLTHLGLVRETLDPPLFETLRRPFALKLFADIVKSGADLDALASSNLLDRWLARADLGNADERKACLELLVALASEMIETETLWRPADGFELSSRDALRRCIACGLIVRTGPSIGFSHQSWLDDFQAKSHRTAQSLADYAWAHQDSLFVRGTILRALERQRVVDPKVYSATIAKLLGDPRTRRHVKHLIADIIAANRSPSQGEAGWVSHWVKTDRPLAQRVLGKIADRWPLWRDFLRGDLPEIIQSEPLNWQAIRLLAAEVQIDADHAARLIARYWGDAEQDHLVFNLLQQAGFVGPEVEERLRTIFARTRIDDHLIAQLVTRLRADKRMADAARILALWLQTLPMTRDSRASLYQLEKLAKAAPLETAAVLVPWFVDYASASVESAGTQIGHYPRSLALPYSWSRDHGTERGTPIEALFVAVRHLATQDPAQLWQLIAPCAKVEIDEVQELIATALIDAGPALAREALDYLLGDLRRFNISHVMLDGKDGVIRSLEGWHSYALVAAIAPGLDDADLTRLRDAIESWSKYPRELYDDLDPESKRRFLAYNRDARYPLLEGLPANILGARRRRVIAEWRAGQAPVAGVNQTRGAVWIGPPMSAEQMARASDADIMKLLDELHDESGDGWPARSLPTSGGVRALSQAFAAFGKTEPERAMKLAATRLQPGKHERAAGALVQELGSSAKDRHAALRDLILDLTNKGFASSSWRQSAANALQEIARSQKGLSDEVIALMESWLETDPAAISGQIEAARAHREANPIDDFSPDAPRPQLFRGGGGADVIPQDNFTLLAAMSNGRLLRQPSDLDGWMRALEDHLGRDENPAIWTTILLYWNYGLAHADRERVTQLIDALWVKYPEIFADRRLVGFFWGFRSDISDKAYSAVLRRWLSSNALLDRQAAAEIIAAGHVVEPDSERFQSLFCALDLKQQPELVGAMYSAAAAWREADTTLREPAHCMIMSQIATATGPVADAISTAVDTQRTLIPDELTREMLEALVQYEPVLRASFNTRFIDGLQSLLFHPGFEHSVLVVANRICDIVVKGGQGIGSGLAGRELVHVAIALQRSEGPLRAEAMDLYERLLDAQIYGAEEAAKASLGR